MAAERVAARSAGLSGIDSAMMIFRGYEEEGIPRGTVLGIGNFDGVHLGHQAIIREVLALARHTGAPAGLLTFDPHPQAVVGGAPPPPMIYTAEEKEEVLASTGLDLLIHQEFDRRFAALSAEEFVRGVLAGGLAPGAVVVGHDFRFGRGGAGDVELLEGLASRLGFVVTVVGEVEAEGVPVRSSLIREMIAAGDVEGAARLLGRPFHVTGTVLAGRGAGRSRLGFPTANILPPEGKLVPPEGVYAGQAVARGADFPAAVNVGGPPEQGGARLVEAHLLDFGGDLYGAPLEVRFLVRLREERVFPGPAELAAQIAADVRRVREILERSDRPGGGA